MTENRTHKQTSRPKPCSNGPPGRAATFFRNGSRSRTHDPETVSPDQRDVSYLHQYHVRPIRGAIVGTDA